MKYLLSFNESRAVPDNYITKDTGRPLNERELNVINKYIDVNLIKDFEKEYYYFFIRYDDGYYYLKWKSCFEFDSLKDLINGFIICYLSRITYYESDRNYSFTHNGNVYDIDWIIELAKKDPDFINIFGSYFFISPKVRLFLLENNLKSNDSANRNYELDDNIWWYLMPWYEPETYPEVEEYLIKILETRPDIKLDKRVLARAMERKYHKLADKLLTRTETDTSIYKQTPLRKAIIDNNINIFNKLINHPKTDVNSSYKGSGEGSHPLIVTCVKYGTEEMFSQVLKKSLIDRNTAAKIIRRFFALLKEDSNRNVLVGKFKILLRYRFFYYEYLRDFLLKNRRPISKFTNDELCDMIIDQPTILEIFDYKDLVKILGKDFQKVVYNYAMTIRRRTN